MLSREEKTKEMIWDLTGQLVVTSILISLLTPVIMALIK